MKALLSINPEHVKRIIDGEKIYEYRKKVFKKEVESVIIYSTMPEGRIIGEFTIDTIIAEDPKKLWEITSDKSGISESFFMKYFFGRDKAYALKIKKLEVYDSPIDPRKLIDNFVAPQSYMYINKESLLY